MVERGPPPGRSCRFAPSPANLRIGVPCAQSCRGITTSDTPGAVKFDFNPEVRAHSMPALAARGWTAVPALVKRLALAHGPLTPTCACLLWFQRPIMCHDTDGPQPGDHAYATKEEMVDVRCMEP